MGRARATTLATLAVLGLIGWLCVDHSDDVGATIAMVPLSGVLAAVALHVATLVLRSEAWRLTLASIAGWPLPRRWVHGANAAAYREPQLCLSAARAPGASRAHRARAPRWD